jgi:hypothetical protein
MSGAGPRLCDSRSPIQEGHQIVHRHFPRTFTFKILGNGVPRPVVQAIAESLPADSWPK